MKNKMTTTIDLNVLLAEVEKSIRIDESIREHGVLRLTLEWELDLDQILPSRTPHPREGGAIGSGTATPTETAAPTDEADRQDSDNWRATVAQFPDN